MIPVIRESKAVLFDLFHTLVSFTALRIPGRNTSEILGVDPSAWDDVVFNHSDDRLRGTISDPVEILDDLAGKVQPGIDPVIIEQAARSRAERFKHCLRKASPATVAVLQELRAGGKKTGLVSNADYPEMAGWAESPLRDCFDAVVFSCACGFVKPEAAIYETCLRRLGIKPSEAVFVGDGGSRELEGAKRVGLRTILTTQIIANRFPDQVEERKKHADAVVDDLALLV